MMTPRRQKWKDHQPEVIAEQEDEIDGGRRQKPDRRTDDATADGDDEDVDPALVAEDHTDDSFQLNVERRLAHNKLLGIVSTATRARKVNDEQNTEDKPKVVTDNDDRGGYMTFSSCRPDHESHHDDDAEQNRRPQLPKDSILRTMMMGRSPLMELEFDPNRFQPHYHYCDDDDRHHQNSSSLSVSVRDRSSDPNSLMINERSYWSETETTKSTSVLNFGITDDDDDD